MSTPIELWRNEYRVDGDMIAGPFRSAQLSVWAAVNTDTGQVELTDIHAFNDALTELCNGWEWREFILVPKAAETP